MIFNANQDDDDIGLLSDISILKPKIPKTGVQKNLDQLPSRELTYPQKIAFWRWFSFSQGGIC